MSISRQPVMIAAIVTAFALTAAAARAADAPPAAGPAAPTPPSGVAVAPITVVPETKAAAQVISSTDAAPLAAPDFTAEDARSPPLAVRLSPNSAVGRQAPPPSGAPGGLLNTNPDLPGGFRSDDVGVTVLF